MPSLRAFSLLAAASVAALALAGSASAAQPRVPSALRRKVINDAVASIRGLASEHGRNAGWAAKAVRVAANLPAREALKEHVVDVVAPTLPVLLDRIDGTKTKPKGIVLHTRGAAITTIHMSLWKRLLNTLIDPNLIAIL